MGGTSRVSQRNELVDPNGEGITSSPSSTKEIIMHKAKSIIAMFTIWAIIMLMGFVEARAGECNFTLSDYISIPIDVDGKDIYVNKECFVSCYGDSSYPSCSIECY